MSNRQQVNILLATYNGEKFLKELLESLLLQEYRSIIVTARDDGSTDDTYQILRKYSRLFSQFRLMRGKRRGVIGNFFELLWNADNGCDMYAFCDQDDVWLPDKISRAVSLISRIDSSVPVMYCSRLEYIGSDSKHLGYSEVPRKLDFKNALVENVVTGATIVINKKGRELLCRRRPRQVLMHDWWCYLVIAGFGKIVYDKYPSLRYRIHEGNLVGEPIGIKKRLRRILARYLDPNKKGMRPSDQATEFYRCYGAYLSNENFSVLRDFLGAKNNLLLRPQYALRMPVFKQSRLATTLLRFRIILGRF